MIHQKIKKSKKHQSTISNANQSQIEKAYEKEKANEKTNVNKNRNPNEKRKNEKKAKFHTKQRFQVGDAKISFQRPKNAISPSEDQNLLARIKRSNLKRSKVIQIQPESIIHSEIGLPKVTSLKSV